MPYENNINPYWNVIITFTTVGYGDITPKTHFGRLFACVSMFFGQFVISLILIAMSISAQFTLEEAKAFSDLRIIEYYKQRMTLGSKILKTYFLMDLCNKYYLKEKDDDQQPEESSELEAKRPAGSQSMASLEKPKERSPDTLEAPSVVGGEQAVPESSSRAGLKKKFVFDRYAKIGNLKASRMLKIQYIKLVREFKELNA